MKTVFFLGAGASKDFGYPLGSELKSQILERIQPRTEIRGNLLSAGHDVEEVEEFLRRLYRADYSTIDEFLGAQKRRQTFRTIGKRAIALCIAAQENEQQLFNVQSWHWYKRLLHFLRNNPKLAHKDSLTFFTFNYDRSLEHYLFEAMHAGEEFSERLMEDFFQDNFFHIHGNIGHLPWQKTAKSLMIREYNGSLSGDELAPTADNILLPDEDLTIEDILIERVAAADVIVFLGFGFHAQNLRKIHFGEWSRRPNLKVYSSAMGLDGEKRNMLNNLPNVAIYETDCTNLIAEFFRRFEKNEI